MKIHDYGKMAMLALLMLCATGALITGSITESTWQMVAVGTLAYLGGNGINALRGAPGSPAIISKGAAPALIVGPGVPLGTTSSEGGDGGSG